MIMGSLKEQILKDLFSGELDKGSIEEKIAEYGSDYIRSRLAEPSPLRFLLGIPQSRRFVPHNQESTLGLKFQGEENATEND